MHEDAEQRYCVVVQYPPWGRNFRVLARGSCEVAAERICQRLRRSDRLAAGRGRNHPRLFFVEAMWQPWWQEK